MSSAALTQPASLVNNQSTPSFLKSLLTPSLGGLKPFQLSPLTPTLPSVLARPQTPSDLAGFLVRAKALMPASLSPALAQIQLGALAAKPAVVANKHLWAFNLLTGKGSCLSAGTRSRFSPSAIGLGLDENRLVRTGTSRLVDTAMIANKLEGIAAPSLALPATPVAVLGLGWSTSSSLSSYPSYKLSKGGLFRRPFTGLSSSPKPLEGLKEGFNLLTLSKTTANMGLPLLTLVSPSMPKFYASAPSLDTQVGAWSSVWSVLTPAPTEDLDPTFINAK